MMPGFDLERVRAAVRKAAVGLGAAAAAGSAATIVFWDVDFYAVRDKWEHFKIAMFGDWRPADRRNSSSGPAPAPAKGSLLERLENYTFFTSIEAKEYGISVQTGVDYSSVVDLLARKHRKIWCYVQISPSGGLPRHINLGTQSGTAPPVYTNLSAYPTKELAAVGLSARTLQSLAKTHCVFAEAAAQPPASSKGGRA